MKFPGLLSRGIALPERKRLGRLLLLLFAAAVAAMTINYVYTRFEAMEKKVASRREALNRFYALRTEYLRKRLVADALLRKALSPRSAESAVAIVEAIGADLGLRERITSIRPLDGEERKGYLERGVEIEVERIGLNEVVNLLYFIETSGVILNVKEFSMRSRFERPELYDLSMKIVKVSKAT